MHNRQQRRQVLQQVGMFTETDIVTSFLTMYVSRIGVIGTEWSVITAALSLSMQENRVRLSPSNNLDGNDYINASHITVSQTYSAPTKCDGHLVLLQYSISGRQFAYIMSQGPLPHTCTDFWQMIWEQKCGLVVMVTNLVVSFIFLHSHGPLFYICSYAISIPCIYIGRWSCQVSLLLPKLSIGPSSV